MPRCGPISACQRLGAFKGPLRSPFACTGRDLPLPRPLKGTMLSSKPRGSGECRLMAERCAEEIIEADFLAQAQDLVGDLARGAVQDNLVEIAPDRIDSRRGEAALHDGAMLRPEVGIDDPLRAATSYGRGLPRIAGDRNKARNRDVATGLREAGSAQFLGVEAPLVPDLGA